MSFKASSKKASNFTKRRRAPIKKRAIDGKKKTKGQQKIRRRYNI